MDVNALFLEAVRKRIKDFNKTRGRRKELNPDIVDYLPLPNRKFGRILKDVSLDVLPEAIIKMAGSTVRTLLKLRPRPCIVAIDALENKEKCKYLFRFKIPYKGRKRYTK